MNSPVRPTLPCKSEKRNGTLDITALAGRRERPHVLPQGRAGRGTLGGNMATGPPATPLRGRSHAKNGYSGGLAKEHFRAGMIWDLKRRWQ